MPTSRPYSRQYMSAVFYHDEEQRKLAISSKGRRENETGKTMYTEIVPLAEFYPAEDYHQKYYLRGVDELMSEYAAMYPNDEDFVASTSAARVNGYVGGNGTLEELERIIDSLGLSSEAQDTLRSRLSRWAPVSAMACRI